MEGSLGIFPSLISYLDLPFQYLLLEVKLKVWSRMNTVDDVGKMFTVFNHRVTTLPTPASKQKS